MIGFDQVLCIDPARTVRVLADGRVAMLGDREHALVEGMGLATVLAWVDGQRTKEEIMQGALRELDELTVLEALHRLERCGCVVAAAPAPWGDHELAFYCATGYVAPWQSAGVRDAVVRVRALNVREDTEHEARRALHDAGVRTDARETAAGARATRAMDFTLLIAADYLAPTLSEAVQKVRAAGGAFCVVQPSGRAALFGPIFAPNDVPCWDCLRQRMRGQRPVREALAARGDEVARSLPVASTAASQRAVLNLVSLVIARYLAAPASSHPLRGALLELDLATLQLHTHSLLATPLCASCQGARAGSPAKGAPISLQAVPKAKPHAGGFRRQSAEETLRQYEHLISARLGPVTYLAPIPGRDSPLRPVYASAYLAPLESGDALESCIRTCAGKGRSRAQARASALSEAVERLSGHWRGDEPTRRASARELGALAIAPRALHNFSDAQYACRDALNARSHGRAQHVDAPLPEGVVIDWTPAWSVSHERQRYVPLSYCYAGTPAAAGSAYCSTSGNGVAAGTCLEEAILQGLLELVERDAVAIWWYNMLIRPRLALQEVHDPYLAALIDSYRSEGHQLAVFDLTHDLQIPVTAAVVLSDRDGHVDIGLGFGCHLLPTLALERALTELNQIGDGRHPVTGQPFLDTSRARELSFLKASTEPSARLSTGFEGPDLAADIRWCVERLRQRELEVLVVDKSRSELGLSVAQVIVPGLRHFWPRFGPGRLYDVPVELGLCAAPRAEAALNSVPLLL